jgi:hypothetical protein
MVPMIEFRRGLDTIINDAIDKMKWEVYRGIRDNSGIWSDSVPPENLLVLNL